MVHGKPRAFFDATPNDPAALPPARDHWPKVFGEKGVHARSAVGTSSLPLDIPVELEAIVQVQD